MLIDTLRSLYRRDLGRLKHEISLYTDEQNMWKVGHNITNSGGNLCLHLLGNLRHFIGTVLGNTEYIRNRTDEFGLKNVPREELLSMIDSSIEDIDQTLSSLTQEQLDSNYPHIVFQEEMTTEWFLVHLESHLGYHLGQINYHRRLLDI